MVGARKRRHTRLVADLAGDDLAHEQARLGLNTFGEAEHRGVGGNKGCGLVAYAAQMRRRHGKDDGLGAVERLRQVCGGDNVAGQLVVHQIPGVAMLAVNAGGRLLAVGPHGHALGSRGGKAGDGGSPGARANQRNIHDSLLLIVGLGDALGKRELGLLTGHELLDIRAMGPHNGDADYRHAKLKSQAAVRKDRASSDGKTDGSGKRAHRHILGDGDGHDKHAEQRQANRPVPGEDDAQANRDTLAAVEVKVGREDMAPHRCQANDAEHPIAGGSGRHDAYGEAIAQVGNERTRDKDADGALKAVEQQRERGHLRAGHAQRIGCADVAGTRLANVGVVEHAAQDQAKRNRSDKERDHGADGGQQNRIMHPFVPSS